MSRSTKKGPFVEVSLLDKVRRAKADQKGGPIKTWSRKSVVIPEFVGHTFEVHNGKKFVAVFVTENMVGHYLGEFSPTRTFKLHSGQRKAGVAAKG